MPENISGVPAGRSVFHLTSPFIGLSHSHNNDGLQKTEPTSNQDQHQQQNQGRLHRRVDTPVIEKGDISNVISKGAFLLSVDMGT
jgi:hypothetical protein